MNGRFYWANNQIFNIKDRIQATVKHNVAPLISPLVSLVKTNYPQLQKKCADFVIQSVEGFSQVFYPSVATKLFYSADARKTLKETMSANLIFYLGWALFIEKSVQLTKDHVPGAEAYGLVTALQFGADLFLIHKWLCMLANNTLHNACVSKTALDMSLSSNYHNHPLPNYFPSCGCGTSSYIQAGFSSVIYYGGNIALANVVSYMPYMTYPTWFWRALVYGQSILEYKIAAQGVCTAHRYEQLTSNNAYSFGIGLAFGLSNLVGSNTIRYVAGLPTVFSMDVKIDGFLSSVLSSFSIDAWTSVILPYFIMVAHTINAPLPGRHQGVDWFFPVRRMGEALAESISIKITEYVTKYSKNRFIDQVNNVAKSDFLKALERLFFGCDFDSLKDLEKVPVLKLFIELHESDIRKILIEIGRVRMKTSMRNVLTATKYLTPILPQFVLSEKRLLQVIFHEDTLYFINRLSYFLICSRLQKKINQDSNLLSDDSRYEIKKGIQEQIKRLNEEKDKSIDHDTLIICLKKNGALQELVVLLKRPDLKDEFIKLMFEDWVKVHADTIKQHKDWLMKYLKSTQTEDFVQELRGVIFEVEEAWKRKEIIDLKGELVRLTQHQIKLNEVEQRELKVANYICLAKSEALHALCTLLDEYGHMLEFDSIVQTWRDYYGHIIAAHRDTSTDVMNQISLFKSSDSIIHKAGSKKTSIEEYIDSLLEMYGNYQAFRKQTSLNQFKEVRVSKQDTAASIVKTIYAQIGKMNITDNTKITALSRLINMIERNEVNRQFVDLLNAWKAQNWPTIIKHRDTTSMLWSNIVSPSLTETAMFINGLEKKYGAFLLVPRVKSQVEFDSVKFKAN